MGDEPGAPGSAEGFGANPHHVYVAVPNLEAIFQRAQAVEGATLDGAIERQAWGERSFYLRDLFGNRLCFVDETTLFTTASDAPVS